MVGTARLGVPIGTSVACGCHQHLSCIRRSSSRPFASFRVVKFEVSTGQHNFWAGFDLQLTEKLTGHDTKYPGVDV